MYGCVAMVPGAAPHAEELVSARIEIDRAGDSAGDQHGSDRVSKHGSPRELRHATSRRRMESRCKCALLMVFLWGFERPPPSRRLRFTLEAVEQPQVAAQAADDRSDKVSPIGADRQSLDSIVDGRRRPQRG